MTTDHAAFIEVIRPLIEFIVSKDGPKLPDWCIANSNPRIYGELSNLGLKGYVECPPAVTAAICMWANDYAFIWFSKKYESLAEAVFDGVEPDYEVGGYSRSTLKMLAAID